MDESRRRHEAIQKIESAQRAIVKQAAELTARGADTKDLAQPILDLQQAVAELRRLEPD